MGLCLYLSPHLDDAVLSCGGLIARQVHAGERALVLTVMAGDPPPGEPSTFASMLSQAVQTAENPAAGRRAEDRAAVEQLGASWLHWDYPDCIYRLDPQSGEALYPSREAIFGEVHAGERTALVAELTRRLQALCDEERPAAVFAPLTVGHHVDHQLVHWAARRLALAGAQLRFYEDYPYAAVPGFLEAALTAAGGIWQAELEALTPAALQAKVNALTHYRSQLDVLFGGLAAMPGRVSAYCHSLSPDGPAERYWQLQPGAEAGR